MCVILPLRCTLFPVDEIMLYMVFFFSCKMLLWRKITTSCKVWDPHHSLPKHSFSRAPVSAYKPPAHHFFGPNAKTPSCAPRLHSSFPLWTPLCTPLCTPFALLLHPVLPPAVPPPGLPVLTFPGTPRPQFPIYPPSAPQFVCPFPAKLLLFLPPVFAELQKIGWLLERFSAIS